MHSVPPDASKIMEVTEKKKGTDHRFPSEKKLLTSSLLFMQGEVPTSIPC